MCMLTYLPPDTQPDTVALTNGTEFNQDGHGYAIVVPGDVPRLIVRHSLDAKFIIQEFARDREKYPEGPALFHSRFGTSGDDGKFNCHPFTVGGDKDTIVAHNGVLSPNVAQTSKDDPRCDTRIAADELFGYFLDTPEDRRELGKFIGVGNKLVFLTVNPAHAFNAVIINEDSGIWEGGIWYSNYDYMPRKAVCTPVRPYSGDVWSDNTCPYCGAIDAVDFVADMCTLCGTCMDCEDDVSQCICYTPAGYTFRESDYHKWTV